MASSASYLSEAAPLLSSAGLSMSEQAISDTPPTKNDALGLEMTFKSESALIVKYSTPLIGTYLLQYSYNLIIILVVSRLGTDELAAVSLGLTTMNIVGFAIFEGMATSLDTLCAQAYGSGNLKLVGLHTQRMILLLLLVATPIGALWICSPWILGAIVPQKELAVMAGSFLRISLIGVPGYAIFEAGKRFVQAQGNFTASLVVLVMCAPVNLVLNWLFVLVRFHFLPHLLPLLATLLTSFPKHSNCNGVCPAPLWQQPLLMTSDQYSYSSMSAWQRPGHSNAGLASPSQQSATGVQ
jgi:multidrug resistance protein, MATE family